MQAAQSLLRGLSPWSFSADELDNLEGFYRANGFAVLSGALAEDVLSRQELECCDAQERLLSGDLPEGYGTTRLIEEGAGQKGARFANYVVHITELSPTAYDIVGDPACEIDRRARHVTDHTYGFQDEAYHGRARKTWLSPKWEDNPTSERTVLLPSGPETGPDVYHAPEQSPRVPG